MYLSRAALSLNALTRVSGVLQLPWSAGAAVRRICSTPSTVTRCRVSYFSTAPADNTQPPQQWTSLEPELEEVLVPRKLSLSPLESWLSLRYSLPPLLDTEQRPVEDGGAEGETKVLPPAVKTVQEDSREGPAPLSCKNVLEIRRRKMNRHKYKKLLKRTKFLRRRVKEGRRRRKQARFERELKRIWKNAGLKTAPEGWTTPKIYVKQGKGN